MQEACSINRADDFAALLGKILDEQEVRMRLFMLVEKIYVLLDSLQTECTELLKKSDAAYDKFRGKMMDKIMKARNRI